MTLLSLRLPTLFCLSLLSIAQPAAQAVTVVLTPSKDNTLYESTTGSLSNGQGDYFYVGKTGDKDDVNLRRGLLAFDLSQIPFGAIITAASLELFVSKTNPNPAASTVNISLHVALNDWGEGLSDADSVGGGPGVPAQSGDATWLHTFHSTSTWTTAGGDFRSTASVTTPVTTANKSYFWTGAGLSGDVQAWVNNPATNFGWFVLGAESIEESAVRFNSSEISTNFPELSVTYTIPEPSTALLLSVAGFLSLGRRRTFLPQKNR